MNPAESPPPPGGSARIGPPWTRAELAGPVLDVAVALLGSVLVVDRGAGPVPGRVAVRLTEVEAYAGESDPGSHAYRGRTARNSVMFGPAGHLYVYFTYGMHWCANVVCGERGQARAVLLRAGEVIEGAPIARERRPACRRDWELASGPARLAAAAGIAGTDNGADLCPVDAEPDPADSPADSPADPADSPADPADSPADSPADPAAPGAPARIALYHPAASAGPVAAGPRVGVRGPGGSGEHYPWRFWIAGDRTVSPYRPAQPRKGRSVPPSDPRAPRPS